MNKIEKMIKVLCPNGVEWKKLGEICVKVSSGGTPNSKNSAFYNGDIPWLRTQEINFKNIYETEMKITQEGMNNSSAKWIPANCVIVAMYGATVGKIGINKIPLTTNQACCNLEINSDMALYKYVFYCLCSQYEYIKSLGEGSQTNINAQIVKNLQIPLPPLPIQTEIVRILDKFVEQQEQLERLIELRKKQYEYYSHKAYSNLKTQGVNTRRIGEFCDLLSGNPFDSNQMENEGIRLMRGMNIKRGILDFSDGLNKYWQTDKGLEKFYLNSDDIVISMDGSLVGRSFAYIKEKDLPLLLVQRVARVRMKNDNPKFLYHYLANGNFADYVDLKKTAGAIPHISMKDISSFQIPLPDIDTQNKIAEALDSFESSIASLKSALELSKKRYEYYRDKMLRF